MPGPELVHPVPAEAAEPWLRQLVTTLLGDPHSDRFSTRIARRVRHWDPERTWGVRDRDRWVATLSTEERTVTVPGLGTATRDLTADALTTVTVSATHRRRGLLTSMLSESLRAAKERQDAVSILIAAEWPIYGRFGYVPVAFGAKYRYRPRGRSAAPTLGDPRRVRQVEPGELGELSRQVFDAARRLRPGQVDRRDAWWDRRLGLDGYELAEDERFNWFVHDGDAGPDGLLAWRTSRDFELAAPLGAVEVHELITSTPQAYVDLWAYLAGLDVIEDIDLFDRPVDEPIRYLLGDGRALAQLQVVDELWLRILDVPAALSARRYAIPGSLVLDVVDDTHGGYAAGRFALAADGDRVECTPTTDAAQLRLTHGALAAAYLGTRRLRQQVFADAVEELEAGALDRADLMFSTPHPPWNATGF